MTERNSSVIVKKDTEAVLSAVDDLRATLDEDDGATLTLASLAEAIENREQERIKSFLAYDDDDREAVDKWFSHYKRGEKHTSAVDVSVAGNVAAPQYIIVRSEMWSRRKATTNGDGDGDYHAVWVVGPAYDIEEQDFFIHRLEWQHEFERDELYWTPKKVRSQLGFDEDLPPAHGTLELGARYRAQGDLAFTIGEYDDVLTDRARANATQEVTRLERKARREWADEAFDGINGVSHSSIGGVSVHASDTEALKALQDALDVDESEIRDRMREDWEQLTAKRRRGLLERILEERRDTAIDIPDTNELRSEMRDGLDAEYRQTRQVNYQHGNHLIIIDNAYPEHDGQSHIDAPDGVSLRQLRIGQQQTTDQPAAIIPEGATLHIIHDEHQTVERDLPPCRIEFDLLDRHRQA